MDEIYAHVGALPPPPAPAQAFNPLQVPQQPKQPAPVDCELSILGERLVELERALEHLVKRIAPALAPLAPQAPMAGSPKPPAPARSALTQVIAEKTDIVALLVNTITGITNRVEL